MTRRYLTASTRKNVKEVFSLIKGGYLYKPHNREIGIVLTYDDINNIYDFLEFQNTQEYMDWVRNRLKK